MATMKTTTIQIPPRYEAIEEIGRGGTSVVLRALDRQTSREVALKILLENGEALRFHREIEQLSSINHPHIIRIQEAGFQGKTPYLVMEYAARGDLISNLENMTLKTVLETFIQICDGLHHLHENGIVHRDIKPGNILLDHTGNAKIADLGASRELDGSCELTRTGTIVGTYHYLAPEQIISSQVGPEADLYSLGVCLFYALTGHHPFNGQTEYAVLKGHLEDSPPALSEYLPEVPECLEVLVMQMLAKKKEMRPVSAQAGGDALNFCLYQFQRRRTSPDEHVARVEALTEEQRSVLLAVGFLGKKADFNSICKVVVFSEDKTDRYLEQLLETGIVECYQDLQFTLNLPSELIQNRLSKRVRKLFQRRLNSASKRSRSASLQNAS